MHHGCMHLFVYVCMACRCMDGQVRMCPCGHVCMLHICMNAPGVVYAQGNMCTRVHVQESACGCLGNGAQTHMFISTFLWVCWCERLCVHTSKVPEGASLTVLPLCLWACASSVYICVLVHISSRAYTGSHTHVLQSR